MAEVAPTVVVANVMLDGVRLTVTDVDCPVPLKGTDCGEPGALSVTRATAERAPVVVGLNVALKVQLAPAARVAVQVLFATMNEEALAPEDVTEVRLTDVLPVFVRVTVCAAEEDPTVVVGKATLLGVNVMVEPLA